MILQLISSHKAHAGNPEAGDRRVDDGFGSIDDEPRLNGNGPSGVINQYYCVGSFGGILIGADQDPGVVVLFDLLPGGSTSLG